MGPVEASGPQEDQREDPALAPARYKPDYDHPEYD